MRKKLSLVSMLLVLGMLATGCGSDEQANDGQSNESTRQGEEQNTSVDSDTVVEAVDPVEAEKARGYLLSYYDLYPSVSDDGKMGYVDLSGNYVIAPQFEEAYGFSEYGVAKIKIDGKYGFIDTNGKIIVDAKYDSVSSFEENSGVAMLRCDGKIGFINKTGKVIADAIFDGTVNSKDIYLSQFNWISESGYIYIRKDDKYGCIDSDGNYAISLKYEGIGGSPDSGLVAIKLDGKYGYSNLEDEIVIEPQYEWCGAFEDNGLALIKLNGKLGAINKDNEIVIEPIYDGFEPVSGVGEVAKPYFDERGQAKVIYNNKYGIVSSNGDTIIKPKFDHIGVFNDDGYAIVGNNNKYGCIDIWGDTIFDTKYDGVELLDDGFFILKTGRTHEIVDAYGNMIKKVFDCAEYHIGDFNKNGLAVTTFRYSDSFYNYSYGVINKDWETVVSKLYSTIYLDSENGLMAVCDNGKFGIMDMNENYIIEPKFDHCTGFDRFDLASVCMNNKWGKIDKNGNYVIEPICDQIINFNEDGISEIRVNGKYGIIDTSGNYILEPIFDYIQFQFYKAELSDIRLDNKRGIIDKSGNIVIEPKYDYIAGRADGNGIFFDNGYMVVGNYVPNADDPNYKDLVLSVLDKNENIIFEKFGVVSVLSNPDGRYEPSFDFFNFKVEP